MENNTTAIWPELPLEAWQETYATLHMWIQIVGKVRLAQAPMLNHWWQVPLYVTARGVTTTPISYEQRTFEIVFDFIDHELLVQVSTGEVRRLPLEPRSVAEFYHELMEALRSLNLEISIRTKPQAVEEAIPFDQDVEHASYDAEYAHRLWRILVQVDRVLKEFRSYFLGKCSPVHFFWGSFDLACTRFSGRRAPQHPGGVPHLADFVIWEAYSHEISSCGFWPGSGPVKEPAFYAYAYPEPDGFPEYPVEPKAAFYSGEMQEFILPYEAVRRSSRPDTDLLRFCESTYEAAADLGNWERKGLERPAGV